MNVARLKMAWAVVLLTTTVLSGPALAQDATIDPVDPFNGITSAEDWVAKFTVEAATDPADPFHNITSGDWWRNGWEGQWTTAHTEGKTFKEFFDSLQGEDGNSVVIQSPYPYTSAEEHWNAALAAANGGTTHTRDSLPDWSGDYEGGAELATSGAAQVGDVWDATAEGNRASLEQILQSELEGRHWWPADGCLPNGYFRDGWSARFLALDTKTFIMAEDQPVNEYRVTYHDGRGHVPAETAVPGWYGQSAGFWDGDELVVWVKDIIGWSGGHALPEYTNGMQIVERWKKIGDDIVADIVIYDSEALAFPWHEIAVYSPRGDDWASPPATHNECVSTNNVYHDELGRIDDFGPENPSYFNIFDPRPWATTYAKSEAAKADGRLPEAPSFMSLAQ